MNEKDLHKYQRRSIAHVLDNTHCALFLEMGLGKTVSTLTAIKHLIYTELEIDKVLVVSPKRVAESVWAQECAKWDHLADLKVSIVSGTVKQRKKALRAQADIYTISRDNIAWLCGLYGGGALPFDMLVIDELSSFKNHRSVRFKALKLVQPSFGRVVGLTGTPAPNGLIDLWAQIYLLDRGDRLGKYISGYRDKFFRPNGSNGSTVYDYKPQKNSEAKIHEAISDICLSMSASDYLDLKETVRNDIDIVFGEDLQHMYNDFEKEKVLELFAENEGEPITAVNATALMVKLQQFANGAIYDGQKAVHEVHNLKIDALKELIEDANGKPVLIAYTFQHDRDRIMHALKKYRPVQLKNDRDILDWNSGKIQVMLMHPASGGHGLNLQHGGNVIVWFSPTWNLELEQQFNARLDRQGQTRAVVINRLIAKKSIDTRIVRKLSGKAVTQSNLMEAVKELKEKYLK